MQKKRITVYTQQMITSNCFNTNVRRGRVIKLHGRITQFERFVSSLTFS